MSLSFACPQCAGSTEVRDSRPRIEGTGIRRRRLCARCGHRFTTWEVQAGDVDALMSGVQNAEPIVFKQAQELAVLMAALEGGDRLIVVSLARRLAGGSASRRLLHVGETLEAAE